MELHITAVIASGHDSLQRLWNSLWILLPDFIIVKVMQSATHTVELNVLGPFVRNALWEVMLNTCNQVSKKGG